MPTLDPERSLLLVIDFQARLMPAIHEGAAAVRNAGRLIEAARLLGVPRIFTEQNAARLGSTVPELQADGPQAEGPQADGRQADGPQVDGRLVHKQSFDVCREPGFLDLVPPEAQVVVAGCEAHVCVLQTALGLVAAGRETFVVADAIGSRRPENREAAIRRMERQGAEMVTTEMVVFEWLGSAEHPAFRQGVALIK